MTQSVRDTKSKSYPGMKLAPVRVFSCNHPLNEKTKQQIRDSDTRQQKEKNRDSLRGKNHSKTTLQDLSKMLPRFQDVEPKFSEDPCLSRYK